MILDDIRNYIPFNEQEERDREQIIAFLENAEKPFSRENSFAHMTASAWIVNSKRDKVLMVYHNLYDSWSWTGGHADGDEDLAYVALKEVREETGVKSAKLLSGEILSLEILTVDGHEKRGAYVPSHLHLNVTYLFEADPDSPVFIKADENSAVGWRTVEQVLSPFSEEEMIPIYTKLIERMQKMR